MTLILEWDNPLHQKRNNDEKNPKENISILVLSSGKKIIINISVYLDLKDLTLYVNDIVRFQRKSEKFYKN